MKIGVVSDTHSMELPAQMMNDFKTVDIIIHAGDFCTVADYEKLAKIKQVQAVYGNMDESAIRKLWPRKQILKYGNCTVGVFHGEGAPDHLLDTVTNEFKNDHVQLIIFGHSHQPLHQTIDHVIYFNPGSPNDTVFAPYRSYGIIEITANKINPKIIKVK